MTIQPQYHWQFTERQGTTVNTVSGVQAHLFKTALTGHGRIGNAVHLQSKDSHINLGTDVGQFGTNDFTVTFGMRNISTRGDKELDIIGGQVMSGHGNFFSVRLTDGRIFFHVDENSKAKHYVRVQTERLSMVRDRTWFHVAVVRKGRTLKIYIDGTLAAEAESKTGVANINNNFDVKLGHSRRGTPHAQYEDLRIYHTALSGPEIEALQPPINRTLRAGEIELVATNKASIILNQDSEDLSRYSEAFQKLRLGPNTGATLYTGSHFEDVAQKLYVDLPDIQQTKLGTFPRSVHIWSSSGEPFTGQWSIKAPNGQYLSRRGASLVTAPHYLLDELFVFHYNINHDQAQLIPATEQASLLLTIENEAAILLVDDAEPDKDAFSIVHPSQDQWLVLNQEGSFGWTQIREDRAIFSRAAKFAENESQVGELAPGEVALYEHRAYHGKTWILSSHITSGHFAHFTDFQGLNDQTSSIRLGPDTGVTLFRNFDFHVTDANREEEIEDMVEHVPDLKESQIGDDAISSIKIFQTIAPEEVFASYTTKLSQDYRMVEDKLEEFSSYRTTLRFEPNAGDVEVSATDLTQIEVEGITYEIDETRSVTLRPNELHFIMITSEADGLDTPGLKIRTKDMALNEHVVIFPNQDAHQQISELEDGALWNATDTQGNRIVDHEVHTKAEVASVQNTIKKMMATVDYRTDAPVAKRHASARKSSGHDAIHLPFSSSQVVSDAAIEKPWELILGGVSNSNVVKLTKSGAALPPANISATGFVRTGIHETGISQDEFTHLLSQSTRSDGAVPSAITSSAGAKRIVATRGLLGSIGNGLKKALKKAKSVVVGAVKGVVHVLVRTAEGVIDFVIDTAKKVIEFVEAVIETVVKGIKKFIEFLQFLFDWDDILETQQYLVGSINAGFDYVAEQIEAVKAPVSDFMDGLQDTVEKGMNQLITTLGGEPSEVRESGFKLPEAVEWFLAKLLGGSKQDNADTIPKPETQPSEDSQLEHFMFHFLEACEDAAGAVLRGFEGLGETIATLVANPLKPQLALIALIETFRDVTIQMLEAIENFALGFLDVIAEAVEQIKNMLNAEIKIPFISHLFELIGAGKLTLLNLTGLLLAIPVTVVAKLVFGETPFKNELLPDFSTPTPGGLIAEPTVARLVAEPIGTQLTEPTGVQLVAERSNATDRKRSIRIWGIIGLTADTLNGLINAVLDLSPESGSQEEVLEATAGFGFEILSLVLDGFSWLASFPSSPDFPGGRPYHLLAHKVTDEDKPEKQERVMWGWRTFLYWLDVALLANKGLAIAQGDKAKLQRLKRAEPKTIGFFCVASILDAIHAIQYLAAIPKKDKSGFEIANEVVSWLPNILAPLRTTGPKGAFALTVLDLVATRVNVSLGSKLLHDDLAELSAEQSN